MLVLRRVKGLCHLVEQLVPALHKATLQLLAQLAHSFFMPFSLACLGTLARIKVGGGGGPLGRGLCVGAGGFGGCRG